MNNNIKYGVFAKRSKIAYRETEKTIIVSKQEFAPMLLLEQLDEFDFKETNICQKKVGKDYMFAVTINDSTPDVLDSICNYIIGNSSQD